MLAARCHAVEDPRARTPVVVSSGGIISMIMAILPIDSLSVPGVGGWMIGGSVRYDRWGMDVLRFTFRRHPHRLLHRKRPDGTIDPDWYYRLPRWLDPGRPVRWVGPSGGTPDTPGDRSADHRAIETVRGWLAAGPDGSVSIGRHLDTLYRQVRSTMSMDSYLDTLSQWVSDRRATAATTTGPTIGSMIEDYLQAGCPDEHLRARSPRAQYHIRSTLSRAKSLLADTGIASLTVPRGTDDYHRRRLAQSAARGRGPGHRAVDIELTELGNCLSWAVRVGRLAANPLRDPASPVPRYQAGDDVVHCASKCVVSDEDFHRLVSTLMCSPDTVVSGARLAFAGLSGLRPGEPTFLRWAIGTPCTRLDQPGDWIECTRDGSVGRKMLVVREKGGCNPAIDLSPAALDFLAAWRTYTAARWPESPWMFPDPISTRYPACRRDVVLDYWSARGLPMPARSGSHCRRDPLCGHTRDAARRLGLGRIVPHGMRAYYVAVRRSQGAPDAIIGAELGHTGGARLITSTYGTADQVFGLGHLDFLPTSTPVAWTILEKYENKRTNP